MNPTDGADDASTLIDAFDNMQLEMMQESNESSYKFEKLKEKLDEGRLKDLE